MPSRAQIVVAAGATAAVGAIVAYVVYKKLRKPKEIIRAALDIGSGEHKLVVAAIDAKGGIRVLHSGRQRACHASTRVERRPTASAPSDRERFRPRRGRVSSVPRLEVRHSHR